MREIESAHEEMNRPSKLLLLIILSGILMMTGLEPVSWAGLPNPGLTEAEIRRQWGEFEKTGGAATVQGSYPYMGCFEKAAAKYRVPLPLLLAVARGESNFNPRARSNKECYGIMQIQWPGTAKDLGIRKKSDLYDPCINIDAGARYLSQLLRRFKGNTFLAVAAYNYGPNAIQPDKVPEGARWYAAYINRHLRFVLSRVYEEARRLLVLEFTFYRTAQGFMSYLEKQVEGVPFEIFKSEKYTYDIYITYKTRDEREAYLKRLKAKTGIKPKGLSP